ncbi:glycoside hydrolase family 15 protein [Motilibacter rhizosphaerae]|uniref:glycoside hydrolase family 15 protein n=1 Tax=Motilibacter rhizosphaerae TaxID=598652 RepID=UPI00102BD5C6
MGAAVVGPSAPAVAASSGAAPGGPGTHATWEPADKHGFGTAIGTGTHSPVWFTLRQGGLSEVFYPDLGTPALRSLHFVVTDARTGTASTAVPTTTRQADSRSLRYTQVSTSAGHWRLTTQYVTDAARASVVVSLRLDSLDRRTYSVFAVADPALGDDGDDDSARVGGGSLTAYDSSSALALEASGGFSARTAGYAGTRSDGALDLADGRLDSAYATAGKGDVAVTGRLHVDGRSRRTATLALGFGATRSAALAVAGRSLAQGFAAAATAYDRGWHAYLSGLSGVPAAASSLRNEYLTSVMVLAASEDKEHPGAFVASPTAPWAWGLGIKGLSQPSEAYHLVWSRDLYQIATALLAAGDKAAAGRALDFLLSTQQKSDGSFPQNSRVDGTPEWGGLQLDEIGLPLVLAWQLGRTDARTMAKVKAAADFLLSYKDKDTGLAAPWSPQERWENQAGYSPATIAAEVAGLVCAADLARRAGDTADADRWMATAKSWQAALAGWTVTTTGPYSSQAYFLRLTKDGKPDAGTTYNVGDGGPTLDQRAVVDPSFLDVVRLGLVSASDPVVQNTVKVVDDRLAVSTPYGLLWHRFTGDGYGETRTGGPWTITKPRTGTTSGRAWPIFAGERGEYELLAGDPKRAAQRLRTMADTANDGGLIAEQVWDGRAPSGTGGRRTGEGTTSATPLVWSHAQFVRLAVSLQAGTPVERPSVVSCTFLQQGC